MDQCPIRCQTSRPSTAALQPGRAILDRQTIHVNDMSAEVDTEIPDAQGPPSDTLALAPRWPRRCFGRAFRSKKRISIRLRTEVCPFSERSRLLLPQSLRRLRPSSPLRMCDCSKNCKTETHNCARPWSIRRQRPRCSGIISRSPTDVQPVPRRHRRERSPGLWN